MVDDALMHGFSGINAQNERFMCTHGAEYALNEHKGKKYYAFRKPQVKQTVDEIFSQLADNERVKKMYELWCELEQKKHDTYSSAKISFPPLADNVQFKSVKNMIIRTVLDMHLPEAEGAAEQEQADDEETDYSPIDVTISDNPSDDKAKQSEQQAKEQEALTATCDEPLC